MTTKEEQKKRAEEARQRKEGAYRRLTANEDFNHEFCAPLKIKAKNALELAVTEALKSADKRCDQLVIDKIREYSLLESAASEPFDYLADIDESRAKEQTQKPS